MVSRAGVSEAWILSTGRPADRRERELLMQFQNIDVVACFRARGERECLVRRRVNVVQASTEQRVLDDGKEAEGGIEPGRWFDVEVRTA